MVGTGTTPGDHSVDRGLVAFEDDLDSSVMEIARRPTEPFSLSLATSRVPEEDALDATGNQYPLANRHDEVGSAGRTTMVSC